jgi:hypothetical protein
VAHQPSYHQPCLPVNPVSPDELDTKLLDRSPAGVFRTLYPGERAEGAWGDQTVALAVHRFRGTGRIVRIPLLAWSEVAEMAGLPEDEARQLVQSFRHLALVA